MSEYVPDGEAVGEGVEAPFNDASNEEVRDVAGGRADEAQPTSPDSTAAVEEGRVAQLEKQLAERTEDLQRVQAEYVNYKRRVDRDRAQARTGGIETVMGDMLPVLDAIAMAAQHEELTGGFKLVAEELQKVTQRYGVEAYGAPGDVFDPQVHDALMQVPGEPGQTEPLVGQVIQTGYRVGDRIVRHARVAVSEPEA